jgi:hypothetical protein
MHDVFIVTSEGSGGGHIVRMVYAADRDDARQTHQANYADEPIVALRWPAQGHVMKRPTTEAEWERWAKGEVGMKHPVTEQDWALWLRYKRYPGQAKTK